MRGACRHVTPAHRVDPDARQRRLAAEWDAAASRREDADAKRDSRDMIVAAASEASPVARATANLKEAHPIRTKIARGICGVRSESSVHRNSLVTVK